MIGAGTIPPIESIRDCKFISQETYNQLLPVREWGWPTGRRIGRQWLQRIYGKVVLCEWVDIKGMTYCDITHFCIF